MQRLFLLLRSNWISALGAVLTTLAFMGFVTTALYLSLYSGQHGAYGGLIAFVVLPGLFVVGLGLIPVGLLVYRKQLKARTEELSHKPFHFVRVIAVLTVINLAVLGTGGYEALHYMDSEQFCGTLCHEVMSPTYEAYVDSPHARVACVDCHIGPGASWFVKSKMSGLRQVYGVLFDDFRRPIPTPVHNLRPARDTCEQCHWPDKFTGDRLVVRKHYKEDEPSTPTTTVLVLKTGGTRPNGEATGIHWHVHPGNVVSYYSPDERKTIPWVRFRDAAGNERIFASEAWTDEHEGEAPPEAELRTMDCVDCHNQPSHGFRDREQALDRAIASGLISRELPFVRKLGNEALGMEWTRESVEPGIEKHLRDHYAENGGLSKDAEPYLVPASRQLAAIWKRNVHPDMKITWGTYPNFIGHTGCFRCHDEMHEDEDGETISGDCGLCHSKLADKEENPEILEQLGISDH